MIVTLRSTLRSVRKQILRYTFFEKRNLEQMQHQTHYRSGALKPKPVEMPFGFIGVLCAVVPGLFIGAAISKSVANFLEENDLFVPSDDDDDDED